MRFPKGKRWILGTAQWGQRYGVMPSPTALTPAVAQELVREAQHLGMAALDTAPTYGDAERTIAGLQTMLPIQSKVLGQRGGIAEQVAASLERCGASRFDCVLIHDWRSLTGRQRLRTARALEALQDKGIIGRSGPSCYSPEELEDALEIFRSLRVAQVPVNVLDQRLESDGIGQSASAAGCRVQARSVFLQGLLIGACELPDHWSHRDLARLLHHGFDDRARAMTLCLAYVTSRPWVSEVVLGAHDTRQLREICQSAIVACGSQPEMDWQELASHDQSLVDPTRWP